jgi:hypothetical protein
LIKIRRDGARLFLKQPREPKTVTLSGEAMTQPCNSFLSKKVHPGGWFMKQTIHPFFLWETWRIRDFFRIFENYFDFIALSYSTRLKSELRELLPAS